MLYPLRFTPIYQYRLWGGNKLREVLGKKDAPDTTGESWEISGVEDNLSVVKEGFLEGNDLQELIEVYMGDLVGDSVYEKFGTEFPLLIKLIDAHDVLSVQVHPDDKLAFERHQAYGKTEMWHVIQADPGSVIYTGFNRQITKEEFLTFIEEKKVQEVLNCEKVAAGDAFFIPAGRVHATGAGILFAEIQQTSDITYRIFDWNRLEKNGRPRTLHTDLAIDAIDYKHYPTYRNDYQPSSNHPVPVASCPYFTVNVIWFNRKVERDYVDIDSFIVYICLQGSFLLNYGEGNPLLVKTGHTILLPAIFKDVVLEPRGETRILEVYIPTAPAPSSI
ncbi:MAG: class I mannose-6-phosphate isomerase [Bacteroidales bacterium]|nr:class I mannose-6-phosphate isomerase [Bacteroidales bacterium]